MRHKTIKVNGRSIEVYDDVFTYDQKLRLYNFFRNSSYGIGWEDTNEIENSNYKYFYCNWSNEDLQNSKFFDFLKNKDFFENLLESYISKKTVANLSYPNNVYFCHTHPQEKVLLYYGNIQWKQEWAGETLFFDEEGKEILYASAYVPGRVIIFDGVIPHTIRAQSSAAPHFRFSLSVFWHKK